MQVKNIGCIGCHQLGQEATRTIPAGISEHRGVPEEAGLRRIQSGQYGERYANNKIVDAGNSIPDPVLCPCGPIVSCSRCCRWPKARPGRPEGAGAQCGRKVGGSGRNRTSICTTSISLGSTNPNGQCPGPLYGSPEYSTDYAMPILDPRTNFGDRLQDAGARSTCRGLLGPGHAASERRRRRRPIRATRHLGDPSEQSQLDVRSTRAGVARRDACARPENPAFCKRARTIRPRSCPRTRKRPATGHLRSENEEIHLRRHLFRNASPAVRLRRERDAVGHGGGRWLAGSIPGRSAETGDVARSQGWTAWVLDANWNGQARRQRPCSARQLILPRTDRPMSVPAPMPSCRARSTARSGYTAGVFGGRAAVVRARGPDRTRRKRPFPNYTMCRCPVSVFAAAISTARASCGPHYPVVI